MRMKTWGWLLICGLLWLPSGARAEDRQDDGVATGSHCLGEDCSKLILDQLLGARLAPVGVENRFDLGFCFPLIRNSHPLLAYTNVRFGAVNYTSPTYVHLGGFFAISPLSILELRAEVSGLYLWPTPFDRTGYQEVDGYESHFDKPDLPASGGTSGSGVFAAFKPTLRARVGLAPKLSIAFSDTASVEFWQVGDEDFYFNCRRDMVMARKDWLFYNSGVLALEFAVHPNATLMVGAMDDLVYLLETGYTDHRLHGLLAIRLDRLGKSIREFRPFVGVGRIFNHREFQGQTSVILGISTSYRLARL
jgi:hypothetical protein